MGKKITKTLDAKGRILSNSVPGMLPINYTYDIKGRVASDTQGTRTTVYAYDSVGNLASIADPQGRTTSYSYDSAGRPATQTFPDGRSLSYAFDSIGNMTSLTLPSGATHRFSYTMDNLGSEYVAPAIQGGSNITNYVYNLDSQLMRITRPDSQTVDYAYNAGGKLNSITIADANTSYAYTIPANGCCGNPSLPRSITRIPMSGTPQRLDYAYDGSLMSSETWSGAINATVNLKYDSDHRVILRTINGSNSLPLTYDNDGLPTSTGAMTMTRNSQSGLLLGTMLGSATTTYTYDQYAGLSNYGALYGSSSLLSVQYVRNMLGRITKKVETIQGIATTYDYAYDVAGRLTDVWGNGIALSRYSYDINGNRAMATVNGVSARASYDHQDRLLGYGNATYTYTANGELSGKTVSGQATAYHYDAFGNLLNVTMSDGTLIEYIIDGRNRRVGKQVNGVLIQGFIYGDQYKPIAELDGAGNMVAMFAYGTKINAPDYMIKGGISYRIFSDHLGSPRLVVNASTGAVVQRIDYDEHGNILSDTNPGFQPFGFAGGLYDAHTKFTRFGWRDYDAETGRWTAKDPILFAGGSINLYGYAMGDPINLIDPDGMAVILVFYQQMESLCLYDTCREIKIKCWKAVSGPYGNGPLPPGDYALPDDGEPRTKRPEDKKGAYCDSSGFCWFQDITPKKKNGRDELGIHPDGNIPGTAGCVGVEGATASHEVYIALKYNPGMLLTVK